VFAPLDNFTTQVPVQYSLTENKLSITDSVGVHEYALYTDVFGSKMLVNTLSAGGELDFKTRLFVKQEAYELSVFDFVGDYRQKIGNLIDEDEWLASYDFFDFAAVSYESGSEASPFTFIDYWKITDSNTIHIINAIVFECGAERFNGTFEICEAFLADFLVEYPERFSFFRNVEVMSFDPVTNEYVLNISVYLFNVDDDIPKKVLTFTDIYQKISDTASRPIRQ
jgi:hypothetical protein